MSTSSGQGARGDSPALADSSPDMTFGELVSLIKSGWKSLLVAPILVGLLALGIAFLMPKTYTGTAKILPPQQNQGLAAMLAQQFGGLAGLAGAAGGLKNPNDQFVALLSSRSVADRLVDQFDLLKVYDSEFREDARKDLARRTDISAGRDGLISIDVDDRDPRRAAAMANAYVEELGRLMQGLAVTEAAQRRVFFERKLEEAKNQLAKAEATLGTSPVSERILKAEPRAAAEVIARLRAELTVSEIAAATMKSYLSDSNPDYRMALNRIAVLRSQLVAAQQADSRPTDVDKDGYIARYREYKYAEGLFELLAKQYELARIDEARDSTLIQVVDKAVVPERSSKPNKALIAIVAALATALVVAVRVVLKRAG